MSGVAEYELIERVDAVARITEAVDSAWSGDGRLILLEGEAGVGKTTLLAVAADLAAASGLRVCSARATEFEGELPNGIVRQLFDGLVREPDRQLRASYLAGAAAVAEGVITGTGKVSGDPFAIRHGMYWLLANVAAHGPAIVLIDDAQWSDLMSVRWLSYLNERLDGLPVAVVVSVRIGEPDEPPELEAIRANPATAVIKLAPLSEDATRRLVRGRHPDAVEEFATACHFHTGGNPFLIHELLDAAAREHIRPDPVGADKIGQLNPEQVGRSVLRRLRRLTPEASALAEAVAIVGDGAEVRHAAAIARLTVDDAALHIDELVAARLLTPARPLRFVHPLVRRAVVERIPRGRRAIGHRRIAELLEREGAGERVAVHLLEVEPADQPWIVARLRVQAQRALERGAPNAAARFLERALLEPPDEDQHVAISIDLGEAELMSLDLSQAIQHLRRASRLASEPAHVERSVLLLARAFTSSGAVPEAADVLSAAITNLGKRDSERRLRLEAEALIQSQTHHTLTARTAALLRSRADGVGTTPAERALLVADAYQRSLVWDGQPAELVHATLAGFDGGLIRDFGCDHTIVALGIATLIYCGAWDDAERVIDHVLADARHRGSSRGLAFNHAFRSRLENQRGDYSAAEADASVALDIATHVYPAGIPFGVRDLAASFIARGDLPAAENAFEGFGLATGDVPPTMQTVAMLLTRAVLRREQGRVSEAEADIARLDAFSRARDGYPRGWVPEVIRTLIATGRRDEAAAMAKRHADEAERWGQPVDRAEALRVLALVRPPAEAMILYEQAVNVLGGVRAPMQRAHAFADLGSAVRRRNRPRDAREPLRSALDTAHRHGAAALEHRVHDELLAAGARPRRKERTGAGALTASERRIVELALQGMSNPEIAQTLFVTRKTVEKHLGGAYLKLGISSRAALADALNSPAR